MPRAHLSCELRLAGLCHATYCMLKQLQCFFSGFACRKYHSHSLASLNKANSNPGCDAHRKHANQKASCHIPNIRARTR